eukprot:331733-Chlamydomonas_euryale.AAC.13
MSDGSGVRQLFFAEGLLGLGGVVGRPLRRCTWRERTITALSPVLMSRLARWAWYGMAQDCA